jgi:hypothetical protein
MLQSAGREWVDRLPTRKRRARASPIDAEISSVVHGLTMTSTPNAQILSAPAVWSLIC